MDTIPVELLTQIATDTFELFTTLLHVNTIGQRLCEQYPQLAAKEKFIRYIYGKHSYLNNKLHSFNDQFATKHINGDKYWYRYGKLHRRDLPAVEFSDGSKFWYWNGKRHRENDLPAIEWYWNNKLHHNNNLPAI
jgi:hypothetical protein